MPIAALFAEQRRLTAVMLPGSERRHAELSCSKLVESLQRLQAAYALRTAEGADGKANLALREPEGANGKANLALREAEGAHGKAELALQQLAALQQQLAATQRHGLNTAKLVEHLQTNGEEVVQQFYASRKDTASKLLSRR